MPHRSSAHLPRVIRALHEQTLNVVKREEFAVNWLAIIVVSSADAGPLDKCIAGVLDRSEASFAVTGAGKVSGLDVGKGQSTTIGEGTVAIGIGRGKVITADIDSDYATCVVSRCQTIAQLRRKDRLIGLEKIDCGKPNPTSPPSRLQAPAVFTLEATKVRCHPSNRCREHSKRVSGPRAFVDAVTDSDLHNWNIVSIRCVLEEDDGETLLTAETRQGTWPSGGSPTYGQPWERWDELERVRDGKAVLNVEVQGEADKLARAECRLVELAE